MTEKPIFVASLAALIAISAWSVVNEGERTVAIVRQSYAYGVTRGKVEGMCLVMRGQDYAALDQARAAKVKDICDHFDHTQATP